ncbi:MAG: hypothetical protein CFE49_09420, partial [Pseudomonas sp. PGPPP3]
MQALLRTNFGKYSAKTLTQLQAAIPYIGTLAHNCRITLQKKRQHSLLHCQPRHQLNKPAPSWPLPPKMPAIHFYSTTEQLLEALV